MGIRKEGNSFRARVTLEPGHRVARMFKVREDAELWIAAIKQEAALNKEEDRDRRNKSGAVDANLLASVSKPDTVGAVLQKALQLDWADKPEQQERGIRACRMLGFNAPIASITTSVLDDVG